MLPALHALFGCEYTAASSRKGKVRPFECLENSQEVQCAFSNLAEDLPSIEEEGVTDIEKFICAPHRTRNWISLMMRGFKFCAISIERKMKISRMIHCKKVLTEKIKMTKFVTRKCMTFLVALQPVWCPSDLVEVKYDDEIYAIKWSMGK